MEHRVPKNIRTDGINWILYGTRRRCVKTRRKCNILDGLPYSTRDLIFNLNSIWLYTNLRRDWISPEIRSRLRFDFIIWLPACHRILLYENQLILSAIINIIATAAARPCCHAQVTLTVTLHTSTAMFPLSAASLAAVCWFAGFAGNPIRLYVT